MGMHEDEDIKIAPSSFSGRSQMVDLGEEAARQFLEQKNCGNIERARALGKTYADDILHIENGPLAIKEAETTQRELHHRIVLYSYVVNRVIAEHSPNSIVAQTCLNVFYTELEDASKELYSHVSDMAAFSLYVLCERTPSRTDDQIGAIYAELCDFRGRSDVIEYGNHFYKQFYDYCWDKLIAVEYIA